MTRDTSKNYNYVNLVDYFTIVSFDTQVKSNARVSFRAPLQDREGGAPFSELIYLQVPQDLWRLVKEYRQPSFLISTLTNQAGLQSYCACFTFYEKLTDKEIFTPKSLILLSTQQYFHAFRNGTFF